MKSRSKRLILEQVSGQLREINDSGIFQAQPGSWVRTIRTAINMSLAQLGKKVGVTAQGVRAIEEREKTGSVTIQSLREIAEVLDMKLVYALVPKTGTLEDIIDQAAEQKAKEIINRTSTSMVLEQQGNKQERLEKALLEKKNELKSEMPKFLWD